MKTITFNLMPAIFLWLASCCITAAQDVAQSDQITDGGITRAREKAPFHGVFYGLRNFCCKTVQFYATHREC